MSESKDPPRLPDVVDEAGETPSWVPWLGFGFLLLFIVYVGASQVHSGAQPAPAAEENAAADGEAAPAPAPAEAAAPAAAPAH